jgi:phospholipid/cholesterol/gamma-HCH transport system substrate-binding protein
VRLWPRSKRKRIAGTEAGYDERVFGRNYQGPSPWVIGLFIVVLIAVGSFLAYTKRIPFVSRGYELHATFRNAATLRPDSPVRIAGVNVGKVISIEPRGDATQATFTVDDAGRPIHDDAFVTIRPRLFLEGNFFLDLRPGSPSAPDLPSGGNIPISDTATAVQLDQILTALQKPERADLQQLLAGYGNALTHEPTAAEDKTQDPIVRGKTAAEAINQTFNYGTAAGRDTAIVSEALQGTQPNDLNRVIVANSRIFRSLVSREADLKGFITNFNTTAGALASESTNLSESIRLLAPTLEEAQPALRHLNATFPPLRAFSIAIRPGLRELPATIRAGEPWLRQTRKLLRERELGGLAQLLRSATPGLAKAAHSSLDLFPQITKLSRCTSQVLVPAGDTVLSDPNFPTGQPNFRELFYGLASQVAAGSSFDGNGSYLQVQGAGGDKFVQAPVPGGGAGNETSYANTVADPLGVQPEQSGDEPPYRPDFTCHKNPVPNLNGPAGAVASPDITPAP